jgi:hypothetical protein
MNLSLNEARRIAVRAQLLDGSATKAALNWAGTDPRNVGGDRLALRG